MDVQVIERQEQNFPLRPVDALEYNRMLFRSALEDTICGTLLRQTQQIGEQTRVSNEQVSRNFIRLLLDLEQR